MKNKFILPLILVMCATVLASCSSINIKGNAITITPEIDKAVSQAILTDNEKGYYEGECPAEGHIIFEGRESGGIKSIYSYITYTNYGFENGCFVDVSGCASPAVIMLDSSDKLIEIKYPQDGSLYASSVKKLFPASCRNKVTNNLSSDDEQSLSEQQMEYAKAYLKEIGRDAKIGYMHDFESNYPIYDFRSYSELLDSKMSEIESTYPYPYWVGNREQIENGVRYVYQLDYDKEKSTLTYTKYQYDKPENIVQKFVLNSTTGETMYKSEATEH